MSILLPECFLHVTALKCRPFDLSHIPEGRHIDQMFLTPLIFICIELGRMSMNKYINCIHTPQIFHFYWNYVFGGGGISEVVPRGPAYNCHCAQVVVLVHGEEWLIGIG